MIKHTTLISVLLGAILFTAMLIAWAVVDMVLSQIVPGYPRGVVVAVGLVSVGISRCSVSAYSLLSEWNKKQAGNEAA